MQGELKYELQQDLMINQKSPYSTIQKGHKNSIESLAAHPSHKSFASGSHDKNIKLWDVSTLKETATLSDHKQGVWSLDYSTDGKLLLSASPDKSVLLWDSNKSSPGQKFLSHKDKVYSARFNQSNKMIASIGEGGQLLFWDIAKGNKPIKSIDVQSLVGYQISWSKNQEYLFVTALGGKILAIDAKNFNVTSTDIFQNEQDLKVEGCTANWKTLPGRVFCSSGKGHIVWYECNNGKLKKQTQFVAHLDGCRNLNLHPHQKYLLSTGKDGSARMWNCNIEGKPKLESNLVFHEENVTSSAFLSDEIVVTGSWDQNIGLWKYKNLIGN